MVNFDEDDNESKINENLDILDVINGCSLRFSTPWYLVDMVFFPI